MPYKIVVETSYNSTLTFHKEKSALALDKFNEQVRTEALFLAAVENGTSKIKLYHNNERIKYVKITNIEKDE